jgi:hypothetical protein
LEKIYQLQRRKEGNRVVYAQTAIFSAKPVSKNVGKSSIVLWMMAREKYIEEYQNQQSKLK